MNRWVVIIVAGVLVLAGLIYGLYESTDYDFEDATKSYRIIKKWELPQELEEVSGIHWINEDQIACVQDEDGILFIFDLNKSKIISKYEFAGPGDYEGLTMLNDRYWVIESDGKLINFPGEPNAKELAREVKLDFEYRNNIEGLAANKNGDLWLSVKERNLDNEGDFKGIYAFDPETMFLDHEPVLKIKYDDPAFDVLKVNNPRKLVRPSDITFSPLDDDLYVLDAEFQKIIIVDRSGKIKELHLLDPMEFEQPEGICFSPSGRMFISNEGLGGAPNIIEIEFLK